MVEAFENTPGHLSQRLVAALEGGQAAGGDTRGQQSAAIVIVKKNCGVWLHNDTMLRLQVDDNPEPIKELRRLVEMWNTPQAAVGVAGVSLSAEHVATALERRPSDRESSTFYARSRV